MIYYYIGDILYTLTQDQISEQAQIEQKLHIKETTLSVPFDYKIDTFELFSKILIYDTRRNQQITDDIIKEVASGKKILVLTERKEHVEVLSLYLKAKTEAITLTGDDAPSRRKIKLDQITKGHFQVLITTGQLLVKDWMFLRLIAFFLFIHFRLRGSLSNILDVFNGQKIRRQCMITGIKILHFARGCLKNEVPFTGSEAGFNKLCCFFYFIKLQIFLYLFNCRFFGIGNVIMKA